jgi:acetyl-CoA acetyltransferase
LGVDPHDQRVNRNGGAIALGHPLGMSVARLALTAAKERIACADRFALATNESARARSCRSARASLNRDVSL